jgi:hypothetical protein
MLDLLLKHPEDDVDYLILTDSDILPSSNPFYVLAATAIRKYRYEALTVNRRTISKGYHKNNKDNNSINNVNNINTDNVNVNDGDDPLVPWTSQDILYLEQNETANYTSHPGTDCYIVGANYLIRSMHYLGYPIPGTSSLGSRLETSIVRSHMAETYQTFPSKYGWTYHYLGDDLVVGPNSRKLTSTTRCFPWAYVQNARS